MYCGAKAGRRAIEGDRRDTSDRPTMARSSAARHGVHVTSVNPEKSRQVWEGGARCRERELAKAMRPCSQKATGSHGGEELARRAGPKSNQAFKPFAVASSPAASLPILPLTWRRARVYMVRAVCVRCGVLWRAPLFQRSPQYDVRWCEGRPSGHRG